MTSTRADAASDTQVTDPYRALVIERPTFMWATVVMVAVLLLTAGFAGIASTMSDENSPAARALGIWGAGFSGLFLMFIGLLNLLELRRVRQMDSSAWGADTEAAPKGMMTMLLGPVSKSVDRPVKMYFVGLLFGLGFDTASTIGLFVIAGGAVVTNNWLIVVTLPLLFTSGMVLFDTIDGELMRAAYRRSTRAQERRRTYNTIMISLSVTVALIIGSIALCGAISEALTLESGPLAWWGGLELGPTGLAILLVFLTLWGSMLLLDGSRRHSAQRQVSVG